MKSFVFITGNKEKISIMERLLKPKGFVIDHQKLEIPEIQAKTVQEVAEFSALYAAKELNKPCVVTDAGCEVAALNGFPGPFVKFMNDQLTADHILKLMSDEEDRSILFMETISYAEPNGFVKSFTVYHPGQLQMQKSGDANLLGKPAPFNEITVFDGCNKVMAEYTYAEMLDYFKDRHDNYHDFADWLSENR